ncbi:hypothetical protein ACSBR1_043627 [Camellia fascicularis]
MANDGQKEKVGNDTPTESGKHIDLDVEENNCNEETRDKNHGGKNVGQEGGVPKKSDRSGYYNEDNLQRPRKVSRKGGRKQFLQALSMAGPRGILTGLRGRSGMENPRKHDLGLDD